MDEKEKAKAKAEAVLLARGYTKGKDGKLTPPAKPVAGKGPLTTPGTIVPHETKLPTYQIPGTTARTKDISRAQHETVKGSGIYGDSEIDVPTFLKNNPTWAAEFERKHPGEVFTPANKDHVKEFQEFYNTNTYKTIYDTVYNNNKKLGDVEASRIAKAAAEDIIKKEGFDPNHKAGDGNPKGVDSDFGQYTQSRIEIAGPPVAKAEDSPLPGITPAGDVAKADPTKADHLKEPVIDRGAPWWIQDIIKTAHAAGNLARIKKYAPWQATADVVRPRVSFLDPTRELAANAEMVNIGAQQLAQFTGPQAFNARYEQLQGRGMAQAADTIARVHNQNVGISNRQEEINAGMINQDNQNRAHQATNLWDKYQTVNQQFDNSKMQARDALVNQYVNAITNKNYTANLNKMYPQFAVDPNRGGEFYMRNPREMKPDFREAPDPTKIYSDILKDNPHLLETPNGDKIAWEMARQKVGIAVKDTDPWTEYQNQGITPQYPGTGQ